MMTPADLRRQLCQALEAQSGLEQHRPYLGMSGIGECSRRQYFDYVQGRTDLTDRSHWYCWTGYAHEEMVRRLFPDAERSPQLEIISNFDDRFRGHIDDALIGQGIIECKSVSWEKFLRVKQNDQPAFKHEAQVQMYLHYSDWQRAFIIYIARDVPFREWNGYPLWVFEVLPRPILAGKLELKAKRILAAVDAGHAPACDCGYCY